MKKKTILIILGIIVVLTMLLVSCRREVCPAYASVQTISETV